jgi:hypothetical protein
MYIYSVSENTYSPLTMPFRGRNMRRSKEKGRKKKIKEVGSVNPYEQQGLT